MLGRPMALQDIGFGEVNRRGITINGIKRERGEKLTHADLASMAIANRNALIENRMISVYPKGVAGAPPAAVVAAVEGEFHIVAKGFGEYSVIKGVELLAKATKEAATDFVVAEQAKIEADAVTAPAATAAPTDSVPGAPKPSRKRRKGGKRRRKAAAPGAPAGAADQPPTNDENGPIE